LSGPEFDFMAQTFEQRDHSFAGFGKKRVVVASDEERDFHAYRTGEFK
jgi:hypothetical protein